MNDNFGFGDIAAARLRARFGLRDRLVIEGHFNVVCRDKRTGKVKWIDGMKNRIVDVGIDWILTNDLAGATLYAGLTDGTPTDAAGDTMASHAGWLEMAGYDEATRPAWGQGEPSSKVVTNASAITFTMDGTDTTIGGAFITTDNTKDGTSGTLIGVKAFTGGDKTVANNDVLEVTYTLTGSSS
jgi:hypothetical protein